MCDGCAAKWTALGGGTSGLTDAEQWSLLQQQRGLSFDPGTQQVYSGTGYIIAARLIERLTGASLAAVTDRWFFKPLGMTRTSWRSDPRDVVPGLATGSAAADHGFAQSPRTTFAHGNSALVTTVDDLLRWSTAPCAFTADPNTSEAARACTIHRCLKDMSMD